MTTLSLIIPTLNAAAHLPALLESLRRQTVAPDEIIVIDSASDDTTAAIVRQHDCKLISIDRSQFDHGRTRNQAAQAAAGDVLLFMTQDALPADDGMIAALIAPLVGGRAAASYARQAAYPDAPPPEVFLRQFNYPTQSQIRTLADQPRLGVRTFFMSNVAAAVDRTAFQSVGGFEQTTIMCEDMILCAKLLRADHAVAYQADAVVLHSHSYSLRQQFQRYFDIGVLMTQAREFLGDAAGSGMGMRFTVEQLQYLARRGAWRWVPRTIAEAMLKWFAYQLGRRHRVLPRAVSRRLSMHRGYWN